MSLCKYKDALGKPKEGVHAKRIFGLAAYDLIATLIGSLIIWYIFFNKKPLYFLAVFFGIWGIGIFLHYIFCVKTPITKLFMSNKNKSSI